MHPLTKTAYQRNPTPQSGSQAKPCGQNPHSHTQKVGQSHGRVIEVTSDQQPPSILPSLLGVFCHLPTRICDRMRQPCPGTKLIGWCGSCGALSPGACIPEGGHHCCWRQRLGKNGRWYPTDIARSYSTHASKMPHSAPRDWRLDRSFRRPPRREIRRKAFVPFCILPHFVPPVAAHCWRAVDRHSCCPRRESD